MDIPKRTASDQFSTVISALDQTDNLPEGLQRFPALVRYTTKADCGTTLLALSAIEAKPASEQEAALGPAIDGQKFFYMFLSNSFQAIGELDRTEFEQGEQLDTFLDGTYYQTTINEQRVVALGGHVMQDMASMEEKFLADFYNQHAPPEQDF